MTDPCKQCQTRKAYAKVFDFHFWGEDCPYICPEYEAFAEERKRDKRRSKSDGGGDHHKSRK